MHGVTSAPRPVPILQACLRPWLIGVLHLPALPGAPRATLPADVIAAAAAHDARILQECGFSAVLIENFHDSPFRPGRVDPETVAALAVVAAAVRDAVSMPLGINVLRNDAQAALAVAIAAGGSFLRVNVLAGAAVTDQGIVQGEADVLLRRRAALGQHVAILADVDVKHATSLDTRPVPLRARELVARAGADAVLVTGAATGMPADAALLAEVARAIDPAPALVASGTTPLDIGALLRLCAGAVVGTALENPNTGRVDRARAAAYVDAVRA